MLVTVQLRNESQRAYPLMVFRPTNHGSSSRVLPAICYQPPILSLEDNHSFENQRLIISISNYVKSHKLKQ